MRRLTATIWSAAALVAALGLGAPAESALLEYTSGHGDVGVAYEDGDLFLHYHVGGGAVVGGIPYLDEEFEPEDVYVRVKDPAGTRPANLSPFTQWDFTGTSAGAPLWTLPQSNVPGKPFLGLGTEELDLGDWAGDVINFALTSVISMPTGAHFSLFQGSISTLSFPTVYWDTSDGLADDNFNMFVGGHDHFNWGFTMAGVYEFEFTASGTHVTDGFVSDTERFTFVVGDSTLPPNPEPVPEPASLALMGLGALGLVGAKFRRRAGQSA